MHRPACPGDLPPERHVHRSGPYKLKRPFRDGTQSVLMEPLAFLERLAALTPRPRKHLMTYHGALAPASLLCASIIPAPTEERCTQVQPAAPTEKTHPPLARARSQPYIPWNNLMRRVFEVDVLLCPHCLGKRRIVAFLDDPIVVRRILRHVGLDPEPRPGDACSLVRECLLDVQSVYTFSDPVFAGTSSLRGSGAGIGT